jgi:hypothetical protein
MMVEAHGEEEARGVNLNSGRAGGVDLDGGGGWRGGGQCGVEVDAEEWLARHRRGGGRCGIEVHVKEEWSVRQQHGGGQRGRRGGGAVGEAPAWRRSVRCQHGGGRCGVKADTEEERERAPVGVWWGNEL